jgi:hypothetical protein
MVAIVIVVLYGVVYSYPVGMRLWTRKGVSQSIWHLNIRASITHQDTTVEHRKINIHGVRKVYALRQTEQLSYPSGWRYKILNLQK